MTHEVAFPPQTLHRLARWAAFTGVALIVLRRFLYLTYPALMPSSAWRPELWLAGTLATAFFELILLFVLLGVPYCLFTAWRRAGQVVARELWIDCGTVVGLYLTALLLF